jgi:5-hydroxyisourate hydrolase-like protein (transthyretin family)
LSTTPKKGLVLVASAPHFVDTTHDVDLGSGRQLTRPRFVQAPQTIDLNTEAAHVVEVLARSERNPPDGSTLSLSLACGDKSHAIQKVAIGSSRLSRFEFAVPKGVSPGNCQLVAAAEAPEMRAMRATRSVLIRDVIEVAVDDLEQDGQFVRITVLARGSEKGVPASTLSEGLIEARENGAFLALSPLHAGQSIIELEEAEASRNVQLKYISSNSALLAGDGAIAEVPARARGFQWAGVHTIALLLFLFWLGYAWLRPRHGKDAPSNGVPPREAVVRESGERSGPISGKVLDAHTGQPLEGMRLVLSAVGADSSEKLEEQSSDDDGRFRFQTALESAPMLKLEASGDDYMSLRSTTRASQVTVHLTHRRRAVVQALVSWAKGLGAPWHSRRPPTPGSVEQTAERQQEPETAEWARAVAHAAYAPSAPSEGEVERLRSPSKGEKEPPSPAPEPERP